MTDKEKEKKKKEEDNNTIIQIINSTVLDSYANSYDSCDNSSCDSGDCSCD